MTMWPLRCVSPMFPPRDIRRRVPYILGLVGLQSKARSMPEQLSGGEQQRCRLGPGRWSTTRRDHCGQATGNIDPELSL